MILKWQTFNGAWVVMDGITSIDNHGYKSSSDIHKMAAAYDGHGVMVHNAGRTLDLNESDLPASDLVESDASLYLVMVVRGERQHYRIPDICQGFLMSDDGKTIDRLLH